MEYILYKIMFLPRARGSMKLHNFYLLQLFLVAAFSINILLGMKDVEMEEIQQPVAMEVEQLWKTISLRYLTERCFQKKEYCVKHKEEDEEPNLPVIKAEDFEKALDAYLNNFVYSFCVRSKWIADNAPSMALMLDSSEYKNFRHPYAQKLILNSNKSISIIGDLHGSMHSDFRRMWRHVAWGNLNENFEIINPNHIFIYLGDVVDRGRNSVEIIFKNIILKLKNPDSFFMLCGNHENPNMGSRSHDLYTIYNEIDEKYGQTDKELVDRIKRKLACFYDTLPQVIYVGCGNVFIQCSHAAFDPSYDPVNFLTNKNSRIIYECLKNKQLSTIYLPDSVRNSTIKYFQERENFPFGETTGFYCVGFTWADFTLEPDDQISFSGHGYKIPLKIVKNYLGDLNKRLKPSGISLNAIIRGHSHSNYGLGMYKYNAKSLSEFCNWASLAKISELDDPNGLIMSNYFPVFTIISAPEGIGYDDSRENKVEFNKDAESIITVHNVLKKWRIKPYDFVISKRSRNGLFCTLNQGFGDDPLKLDFYENKPEEIINFKSLKSPDLFEQVNIKKIEDIVFNEIEKEKQGSVKKELGSVSLKKLPKISAMTQSLVHFKHVEGIQNFENIDQVAQEIQCKKVEKIDRLTKKIEYKNCFNDKNVLDPIKKILAREQIFHDKYFVMYHGCDFKLIQLYLVLQLIYSWGFLRNNQPLPTRFIKEHHTGDFKSFLDYISNFIEENKEKGEGHFFYKPEESGSQIKSNYWLDEIPQFRDQLLSVNCALTGNLSIQDESSVEYWLARPSESKINLEKIFKEIFDFLEIQPRYIEKIMSIQKKCFESIKKQENSLGTKLGILLQIFIDKSVFDEVAYFAQAGGAPFDHPIFRNFNEEKLYHTESSPFLQEYINNPERLNTELNKYVHEGVDHTYNYSLDNCQFRIWLPSPYLYDPKFVKTFYYTSLNETDEKFIQEYLDEMNQIFELIIKDIIRQKIMGLVAPFALSRTPLKNIEHKIVKLISELKIKREMGRLGIDTRKMLESVTLEQKLNYAAQMDKISPSVRKDLIDYLKKFGHIKLPNSSTPLILAIQLNRLDLVEIVFESFNSDSIKLHFFDQDYNGQTALLWALKNKNEKIIDFLIEYLSKAKLEDSISKKELIALIQCSVQSARKLGFDLVKKTLKVSDPKSILEMEKYLINNANKEDKEIIMLILQNIFSTLEEGKITENQLQQCQDRLLNLIEKVSSIGLNDVIDYFASEFQKIFDSANIDQKKCLLDIFNQILDEIDVYSECNILSIMIDRVGQNLDLLMEILKRREDLLDRSPDNDVSGSGEPIHSKVFNTIMKFAKVSFSVSIQELSKNHTHEEKIKFINLFKEGMRVFDVMSQWVRDDCRDEFIEFVKKTFLDQMFQGISLLFKNNNIKDALEILLETKIEGPSTIDWFLKNEYYYIIKYGIHEHLLILPEELGIEEEDKKEITTFLNEFFRWLWGQKQELEQVSLPSLWIGCILASRYEDALNCYRTSRKKFNDTEITKQYLPCIKNLEGAYVNKFREKFFRRINDMSSTPGGNSFSEYQFFVNLLINMMPNFQSEQEKTELFTSICQFSKVVIFKFHTVFYKRYNVKKSYWIAIAQNLYKILPINQLSIKAYEDMLDYFGKTDSSLTENLSELLKQAQRKMEAGESKKRQREEKSEEELSEEKSKTEGLPEKRQELAQPTKSLKRPQQIPSSSR